ncbi:BUD32 family EKC/KEOPS complex subunit [Pseudomonas alabamensis]|uniref:toluene tolerance protein n=1 Tax=Pseudomonas alabamensis TaxID=3064349 RepID=UPI000745CEDA|nr:toluene tolerance protein [Pseudomonas entomophila]AMA47370.1 toluene tolerance protein [Pseudomonas monteilii]
MQPLDHTAYLTLREGARVIEADGSGDKVLQMPDGRFLKLFRRKRWLTSAALFPYAQRFADNARRLRALGIETPEVLAVYRIKSIERDGVYYAPLAGSTLRQLIQQGTATDTLRERYGAFVARLHDQGVYFRSLHLGNVVLTPAQVLGLIDIADLSQRGRALGPNKRLRNFQHMLRYREDRAWLRGDDAGQAFLRGYAASLPHKPGYERLVAQVSTLLADAPPNP